MKKSQYPNQVPVLTDNIPYTKDPGGTPQDANMTIMQLQTLLGNAPVQSVNGATGTVVIGPDDLSQVGSTNKFVLAADLVKLANLSGTNSGDETDATIKSKYENNADTNAFTDAEKTAVGTISTLGAAVALNTAKVSADGSVDSHSDVDVSTTTPVEGDVLVNRSGVFVPEQPSSGGGGGSLQKSFTLNEDIGAAGTAVALRGDGEIEAVFAQSGQISTDQDIFAITNGSQNNAQEYDPVNDRYVLLSQPTSGSNVTATMFEVTGLTATVVGTPITINTVGSHLRADCTWDPVHEVVLAHIQSQSTVLNAVTIRLDSAQPTVAALFGSISGFQILDATYHAGEARHIQLYKGAGGTLRLRAIELTSNVTGNAGTELDTGINTIVTDQYQASLVYDSVNDKMFMFYTEQATTDPKVVEVIVSGSTITLGTPVTLPYNGGEADFSGNLVMKGAFDPDKGLIVCTLFGTQSTPGSSFTAHVAWVVDGSGSAPVASSMRYLINDGSGNNSRYRAGDLVYDQTLDTFILFYQDNFLDEDIAQQFSINAGNNDFDIGTKAVLSNLTFTSNFGANTVSQNSGLTGEYFYSRGVFQNFIYGAAVTTNSENFIGFLDEAGLATESKPVNVQGGVDTNQSGLTIGANYYMDISGNISTTPSDIFVGQALSATDLSIVKEDPTHIREVFDDKSPILGGELAAAGNKIINLGAPTADADAANKLYVDGAIDSIVFPTDDDSAFVKNADFGVGAYDITTAVFSTKELDVSSQDQADGMFITNDGTKMYTVTSGGDRIYQYNFGTPGDLATAVFANKEIDTTATTGEDAMGGIHMSADGTKLWVCGLLTDKVYLFDLSVPFEIDSAVKSADEFDVSVEVSGAFNVHISADGTFMSVMDLNNTCEQYTLVVPFDITSAVYANKTFTHTGGGSMLGFAIDPSGTRIQTCSDPGIIHQYILGTAFELDTATIDPVTLDVSSQDSVPRDIQFLNNGYTFFVSGQDSFPNKIFQFDIPQGSKTLLVDQTGQGNPLPIEVPTDTYIGRGPTGDIEALPTSGLGGGGGGQWTELQTVVATGTANAVDFIDGVSGVDFSGTYKKYKLEYRGVKSDNSTNTNINLYTSPDTVPNFNVGANEYIWGNTTFGIGQANTISSDPFDARMRINAPQLNNSDPLKVAHGEIYFWDLESTTENKLFEFNGVQHVSVNEMFRVTGFGQRKSTAPVLAIRIGLALAAANISGTFTLYGSN